MVSKSYNGGSGQLDHGSVKKDWSHFTEPPAPWNVNSRVMAVERRRGNSVYYFLGGEDRTHLLWQLTQKTFDCDRQINIDDIRVGPLDAGNEAGIHMVFRHRPQP